jgi:threonine/homoserine/homoserine lactone efflux protein
VNVLALVLAAVTVGSLHTMAPDHWMPFAALARSRGWSARRAARTTILCGFGHVTVSAALGIAALFAGLAVIHAIGARLESHATLLLMGFGTVYMIWGLWRSFRRDPHSAIHPHRHAHGHHDHDHGLTEWSLFVLFSADPCVAVIPMIIAAAGAGWHAVLTVVLAYELATIATMVVLVTTAHAGARAFRAPWIDRYGDATAGAVIVMVGAAVRVLGI